MAKTVRACFRRLREISCSGFGHGVSGNRTVIMGVPYARLRRAPITPKPPRSGRRSRTLRCIRIRGPVRAATPCSETPGRLASRWSAISGARPLLSVARKRRGSVPDAQRSPASKAIRWAKLLARAFAVDVEHCGECGGPVKILAAIHERTAIDKILRHLGHPQQSRPPERCR